MFLLKFVGAILVGIATGVGVGLGAYALGAPIALWIALDFLAAGLVSWRLVSKALEDF